MEKLPPEKSMMNHSARLHATGHIQTIPIIMTQVCSPPTLLPCTSTLLTSQIVRNFSKLPSPNFKMTQSPLLKHDPTQTGWNGKQQWTVKLPCLNKLAHGSQFPNPLTRTLLAANGYSISSATPMAPSKSTRPDSWRKGSHRSLAWTISTHFPLSQSFQASGSSSPSPLAMIGMPTPSTSTVCTSMVSWMTMKKFIWNCPPDTSVRGSKSNVYSSHSMASSRLGKNGTIHCLALLWT